MKIGIILGTRPEIIKMSPVIRECQKQGLSFFILHTGQHYSKNMDEIFFKEMSLPKPRYNLKLGMLPYRKQVGFFLKHITEVLKKEKPDVVLVQGDTVTVVTGALAANKLGIKVGHLEAGLRCHDTSMLEEVNRILADHVSEYLFAPTVTAVQNLVAEGFDKRKIFLTGNTIVDAVTSHKARIAKSRILKQLALRPKKYILVTAHRAENVDKKDRLENIVNGLKLLKSHFEDYALVFPMHPRTEKRLQEYGLAVDPSIQTLPPVGYFDMLALQKNAKLIITDSGGVQEEACIFRVPLITIRDNTERPETVALGVNTLVPGVEPAALLKAATTMLKRKHRWQNPFGNDTVGKKILALLKRE